MSAVQDTTEGFSISDQQLTCRTSLALQQLAGSPTVMPDTQESIMDLQEPLAAGCSKLQEPPSIIGREITRPNDGTVLPVRLRHCCKVVARSVKTS